MMGSFKLGGMTLTSIFKKKETVLYPKVERSAPPGLKGHVTNDINACIFCRICEKRCPTGAIGVSKEDRSWSINAFLCIQCGYCVRECPKDALEMDPSYTLPAYERRIQVLTEEGTTIEEIPSDRLDPLLGDQRFESPAPRPIAKAVPPEEGLDETEMDDVAIEMIDEEIASGTADEKRT